MSGMTIPTFWDRAGVMSRHFYHIKEREKRRQSARNHHTDHTVHEYGGDIQFFTMRPGSAVYMLLKRTVL